MTISAITCADIFTIKDFTQDDMLYEYLLIDDTDVGKESSVPVRDSNRILYSSHASVGWVWRAIHIVYFYIENKALDNTSDILERHSYRGGVIIVGVGIFVYATLTCICTLQKL